ncbi:MAG: tyrosine type site-specific recombinase [Bacteroidetes bacterium B1(2017)]|nr:MAG: tyrosine type site-specific recombinase [Bacteroidetes bacterium B1(2017)]
MVISITEIMPEARFVLKEPEAKEPTLIYLFYNFNYKRLKYSTGEKILPKYWNSKEQKAKQSKDFQESTELNVRLKNIEACINDIYRKLVNDGIEPSPEKLREVLNNELIGKKPKNKTSLFEFIDIFIDEAKLIKKQGTYKTYITFKNHLTEFAKRKNKSLNFEDINLEFYSEIISYLTNEIKLSPNSIGSFIKNLKSVLNEATERGVNSNLEFRKKKFTKPNEITEKIYLTLEELATIYELDLTKSPKLERTRDLFIIGCHTGLRFSDYIQMKNENIVNGNKLKIKSVKTNQLSYIPLNPVVLEILNKYSFQLPKGISNQKMNEYLKEIGKLANLDEPITINSIKGGAKQQILFKKYELISTHCARRSFATNAYLANVPVVSLMKITGHSQEKTFLQYIRISQEENANNLLNHPFFN